MNIFAFASRISFLCFVMFVLGCDVGVIIVVCSCCCSCCCSLWFCHRICFVLLVSMVLNDGSGLNSEEEAEATYSRSD